MTELFDVISPYLEIVSLIIQVLGIPLAAAGLYLSARSSARSRNLSVLLSFIESFQSKWEGGWSDSLEAIEEKFIAQEGYELSSLEEKQLRFMLNWIDWIGNLKSKKVLVNSDVLFSSLGFALKRIICAGEGLITDDIKKHGPEYWAGLLVVQKTLK